ncbi:MAG: hypothetical protein ABL894_00940 [Hyphomicrobium sp.]
MKYLKVAAALFTVTLVIISESYAGGTVDEHMSCRAVRAIFDASQPDMAQVREVYSVVEREFTELDRKNATRGRPKIFARMTDEGKQTTSAVVTARCDDHPKDSVKQSTKTVYEGIEAMGDAVGVNE